MKAEELVINKDSCCGCGACAAVCPQKAISLRPDSCGFIYPDIDESSCFDCGACVRVCQYHNPPVLKMPREAYAACGKDGRLVENSASGGVFASVGKSWLAAKGLLAGAVLEIGENGARVFHLLGEDESALYAMQGSKYVQSDAYICYSAVLDALRAGRRVLFSGTPCQIAAIKKLSGDPENLVTLEIVCHGVPSLRMFDDFQKIMAKLMGGKIKSFVFRDKSSGKEFCAKIEGKSKNWYLKSHYLSFYNLFLKGKTYRDSCYSCPYAGTERAADLTMGDFWGFEEFHGKDAASGIIPRKDHWSCLLVNTEKGSKALEEYGSELELVQSRTEWVSRHNRQLRHPSEKPADRENILRIYSEKGYEAVEKAYIKSCGGYLSFYRRMFRNLMQNKKAAKPENKSE